MSSYVASCCMCCRVASFVSGTSVSSPAAAAVRCFRSVSNCFPLVHPPRRSPSHPTLIHRANRRHSGLVRCAAPRCSWSNDSPLLRSSSALPRTPRLPEMLKPFHCRPSNASSSGRGFCATRYRNSPVHSLSTRLLCILRPLLGLAHHDGLHPAAHSNATYSPPTSVPPSPRQQLLIQNA